MGTQAGVGASHHHNPRIAGREAVERARRSGNIERVGFVFMHATVGYDQRAIVRAVREATGNAPLCGCSGEGTIVGDQADESNFSVAVLLLSSDELRFQHGITPGLKADSAAVGRAIARAIRPGLAADTLALFLFPDAFSVNFDRLAGGLEGELQLDRFLPLLGGTAGDNWAFAQTYQYCDDLAVSDGAAWALLSGPSELAWSVNHGCLPIGVEHAVARSEGNTIYEIDGKPALEMVREYLTEEELADWGRTAVNMPFGFKTPTDLTGYDQYLIRAMFSKDETTGAVAVQVEVPEGTRLWMARRDFDKVLAGVDQLAAQLNAQLDGRPPKVVFHFDCAGRGKVFVRDQLKLQLLKRLQHQLPAAPWFGFYTYGEIAPVGERNCYHNYTAVVAALA